MHDRSQPRPLFPTTLQEGVINMTVVFQALMKRASAPTVLS